MRARYVLLGLALFAVIVVGVGVVFLLLQPASDLVTVKGVLKQGVEAGCTILETDDGRTYTLIGISDYRCGRLNASDNQESTVRCLPPYGKTVVVTGYIEQNAASYCMQGPLLHVESLTVLS
jgi:hypothetical protein